MHKVAGMKHYQCSKPAKRIRLIGSDTTGGAAPAEDDGPDEVGDFQQQLHTLMGCVVILTAALIYLEHPNQLSK